MEFLIRKSAKILLCTLLLVGTDTVLSAELQVAVASNFSTALTAIARRFTTNSGHPVNLITGSTGQLYAQINHGAPFDIFFAADVKRPELLEKKGVAMTGSRFTYALGRVVLWSPEANFVDTQGAVLKTVDFRYLALANPKLAPYGRAAEQVLRHHGLWRSLQRRMVRGENISQSFQFVKSGNAKLGFVALSQLKNPNHPMTGSLWEIPTTLYDPIEQQAVLLQDKKSARDFLAFVKSPEGRTIIRQFGYTTP